MNAARNVWNVLIVLVFAATFMAAWGVVGSMALWQPPMVEESR